MYLNIIDRLDDIGRFALKRYELSGDTVANMIGSNGRWRGLRALADIVQDIRPRFVLFSGGGNDLIGAEFEGALHRYNEGKDAAWHLNTTAWKRQTRIIVEGYEHLATTIGSIAPVFAHGYDYIVPSDKPVRYDGIPITGPWIYKEMERAGIPRVSPLRADIAAYLINWFNNFLADLEHSQPSRFAHLDLRGTLGAEDWQNEIHPTRNGFKLVAARFIERLDATLTPTLAAHDDTLFGGLT